MRKTLKTSIAAAAALVLGLTFVMPASAAYYGKPIPVSQGGTGAATLDGAGIVTKTGAQTISGVKTFSTAPTFSTALDVASGGTGGTTLDGAGIVTKAGAQTISGAKSFSVDQTFSGDIIADGGSGNDILVTALGKIVINQGAGGNAYIVASTNGANPTMDLYVGGTKKLQLGYPGASESQLTHGSLGIGVAPTAALHLKAGTATANTAPLKLTAGTNLTAAETGAVEFSSNKLYFTPNTTREQIFTGLTATATLDFPNIAAGSTSDLTITVTGATTNDTVMGGPPAAPASGIVFDYFVSAADTVTVRAANVTTGAIDPASATYRATVLR